MTRCATGVVVPPTVAPPFYWHIVCMRLGAGDELRQRCSSRNGTRRHGDGTTTVDVLLTRKGDMNAKQEATPSS